MEPTSENADLIRECIKRLMEKHGADEVLKPITNEELQASIGVFEVGPALVIVMYWVLRDFYVAPPIETLGNYLSSSSNLSSHAIPLLSLNHRLSFKKHDCALPIAKRPLRRALRTKKSMLLKLWMRLLRGTLTFSTITDALIRNRRITTETFVSKMRPS